METMTVAELIEILKDCNEDSMVCIGHEFEVNAVTENEKNKTVSLWCEN